jgi:UPF0176 protein
MAKALYNKVNREVLLAKIRQSKEKRTTISFYQYANIGNPRFFRDHFYGMLDDIGVLGRIYVSYEGLNAQVSVPENMLEAFREKLNDILFLKGIRLNYAIEDDGKSFFKLTIKVREKIVADGLNDASFDVTNKGKHLTAPEFNELTDRDDVILVDMRNHYESEVGHFENAITPDVETFREALPYVEMILDGQKDKHLVMYCTGGIRCEKASAYFKHKGFNKVYQLEGGIIEYARQARKLGIKNKFLGKNFVFDERLGERIGDQVIAKCHQCGTLCDTHVNCDNDHCHILFIQCQDCKEKYASCCSIKCKDFKSLPVDEKQVLLDKIEFNGTRFGKGRYKALTKDEQLVLT